MRKENHQSKLDRSINPDEPAFYWRPKFKTKMLGRIDQLTNLAEKNKTSIMNKKNVQKLLVENKRIIQCHNSRNCHIIFYTIQTSIKNANQ